MTAPPPHFLTFTGNLLAERTLEFDSIALGQTHRATRETFQVGGKGINVSKMLTRLGAPNTALCFAGGTAGADCEAWLRDRGFTFQAFSNSRPTRSGLVVRARDGEETTFLGPDAAADSAAVRACTEFLSAQPPHTVLAVCGSVPGWAGADLAPLREALRRWPERGPLIVDIYGPPLAPLVHEPAALIKVNRGEFQALFSAAEAKLSTGELLRLARERFRAQRWTITDGAAPVWFMDEQREPETIPTPRIRQISATGSGDVLLACILHARYYRRLPWRDALIWSLPYAAANAAHPGIAEFPDPGPAL